MIFCDWIEQGQALADALDVPFIHGNTPRKLEKLEESDVCVVSRVGDRGISFPDLRLVIEVAGAGSAREQFAQRVGRLLHGDFEGEFITVFTPEEAAKYRGRVFGVEAELAGEVDIEFMDVGNVTAVAPKSESRKPSARAFKVLPSESNLREPADDINRTLRLPSVLSKMVAAQKYIPQDAWTFLPKVMRYCWTTALSPKEIAEVRGLTGRRTLSRWTTVCRALHARGLLKLDADGRYRVNHDEIQRLKTLSEIRR